MPKTQTKHALPGSIDEAVSVVRRAYEEQFATDEDPYPYVESVFVDFVIVQSGTDMTKVPYTRGEDDTISFGSPEPVELEISIAEKGSLTAPIVWKDEAKRIVYGPVLVPDVEDSDGDVVTAEKIEAVAHKFLEEYRLMEHMHSLKSIAHPVESYLAPVDMELGDTVIPKGTWVVGAKINDDGAWEEVTKGQLTGFSIVAVPTGATKKTATKKLTLRDIEKSGQDWEVIAIGLVDEPAVPLAKWTAVKRDESAWERLKSALFSSKEKQESPSTKEVDVDEKELKELVTTAVTEATTPLSERLDALEKSAKEKDDEQKPAPKSTEEPEGITKEQLDEALKKASEDGALSVLEKFGEVLESQPKATVKSLTESIRGQDGHESGNKPPASSRDPWGRRREVAS